MLTATQIELHNARKARLRRIEQAAARDNPKTDKEFSAALNAVAPSSDPAPEPDPEVEWAARQIEEHKPFWFSVVDCIKLTPRGNPTIRAIQLATCEAYGVTMNDILSARRTWNVVLPRQVSMYLAKELTALSYPRIARATGDRDHTTALHGFRKIEALIKKDEELAAKVAMIRGQFNEASYCCDDEKDSALASQETAQTPMRVDRSRAAEISPPC